MADKATKSAEELAQAYNKAIASGFAVADAGIAQTTAAVKMFTDTVQTERDEYGKAVEQAAAHACARGENLASVMQSMTAAPKSGATPFTPRGQGGRQQAHRGRDGFLPGVDQGLDGLPIRR